MKYIHFVVAIALTLLISCAGKAVDDNHEGYIITGNVQNFDGQKILFEQLSYNNAVVIDTAAIDEEGNFEFKGYANKKSMYNIKFDQNNGVLFPMDKGKQRITVQVDYNLINDYTITGAPGGNSIKAAMKEARENYDVLIGIRQKFEMAQKSGNNNFDPAPLQKEFTERQQSHLIALRARIDSASDPVVGVFLTTLMNPDEEMDFLRLYAAQIKSRADNGYTQEFVRKMESTRRVAVGEMAPEINLASPDGPSIPLSSLRGKYVLIDFWAAWCRPCRMNNPHLVQMYNKYKDKGFAIYSVSLDKNKGQWLSAIKQDGLIWGEHVSDLKFWQSQAAQDYNIRSIPATVLLDKEGKIIAMKLRGDQLETKLEEIFGS